MRVQKLFLFTIIATSLLSCQKKNSEVEPKIDDITFSYVSGLRIPFNQVNVSISKTNDNQSAFAIVQCEPLSDDPKWKYSKINKYVDIDIKTFERFAKSASDLNKINIDIADLQGLDGSTWKIEFGAKGKNTSYSFWCPMTNEKERGLTEFVNLSKQILEKVKLDKKEILEN